MPENGNELHLRESEESEHELDDGQGSSPSTAPRPAPTRLSTESEGHLSRVRTLESIPEVPIISVSAASEEARPTNQEQPTTSIPPAAGSQPKTISPPSTAPTSSWWKRGLGMAFTGESTQEPDARKSKIGNWWAGADSTTSSARSSRVLTGAPPSEVPAVARLKKSHSTSATEKNSALSSISSMISRLTTTQSIPLPDGELCDMDLEAALPAPSAPEPAPEDYHALYIQSLTLLSRFQEAYKSQSATLLDLQAECSAERDEAAQVAARERLLRSQFDDVLARAAEQEAAMVAALEDLNNEKRARLEVEGKASSTEGSVVTEDLSVEDDQRRDGSETDDESIFSRSRSPTLAEESASPPFRPRIPPPRSGGPIRKSAPAQAPRLSAFQKIVRGIAGEDGGGRCSNCRGGDAGIAWDTVSLLRDENKALKQQVGTLESAVDGALDIVNGVGL